MATTDPAPPRPSAAPPAVQVHEPRGPVPYGEGWAAQRAAHARVMAGGTAELFLLEHEAVYTAGSRTLPDERPTDGTPVVDVDRGGKITWHGPGQLVGYPILALPEPLDVVAYVRRLEGALMAACADLGVETVRVDGRSGVWVRDEAPATRPGRAAERKVAAVGIRVGRGVTMHGFALNCDCDLAWADPIVPCGIADAGVTSLTAEAGRHVGVAEALPVVRRHVLGVVEALAAAPALRRAA